MLLEHWRPISCDLLDVYGVDVWDRGLMRSRNWGWLREKILGLLDRPGVWTTLGDRAVLMFTTRIQEELFGSQRDLALAEAADRQQQ